MADFNALQAIINAYIKRNGVQAITGQILNGVLTGMVNALGKGYTVAGAASPTTDPGTMTGPLAYIAYTAGTYTHFDNLVVEQGEVSMLIYNEAEWHKEVLFSLAAQATVDDNIGVPSVGVSFVDGILTFDFRNMKGEPGENGQDGDPAGFGAISATITGGVGTPGVSVQSSGPDTAKNIAFQFTNLKGETGVTSCVVTVDNTTGNPSCAVSLVGQELHLDFSGLKGAQGDTGSSVDYPFTIVNNLTTDDATQALSAAMGVELAGQVSQLEHKVDEGEVFSNEVVSLETTSPYYLSTQTNMYVPSSGKFTSNQYTSKYQVWLFLLPAGKFVFNRTSNYTSSQGTVAGTLSSDEDFAVGSSIASVILNNSTDATVTVEFESPTYVFIVGRTDNSKFKQYVTCNQIVKEYVKDVLAEVKETVDSIDLNEIDELSADVADLEDEVYEEIAIGLDESSEYFQSTLTGAYVKSNGTITSNQYTGGYKIWLFLLPAGKYSAKKTANYDTDNGTVVGTLASDEDFVVGATIESAIIGASSESEVAFQFNAPTYLFIVGKTTGAKLKYYATANELQTVGAISHLQDEVANMFDVNLDIVIPDTVYAIVGTELNLYNDAVSLSIDRGLHSPLNYRIRWNCNKGTITDRCFRFTPVAGDVGNVSCACELYDMRGVLLASKTFTIKVLAKNALSSAKSIVYFGDSLGANVATNLYDNFHDSARFSGTIPKMLGTKGTTKNYEAVGGYKWSNYATAGTTAGYRISVSGVGSMSIGAVYSDGSHNFTVAEVNITEGVGNCLLEGSSTLTMPTGTLTKVSGAGDASVPYTGAYKESANPLWNGDAGELDLDYYKQTLVELGQLSSTSEKIDAVSFQFGINDNSLANDLSTLRGYISDLYNLFIDDNADCIFIVGLTTSCGNTLDGSGANYGASENWKAYQENTYIIRKFYLSLLADFPNMRIATPNLSLDRFYGYPFGTRQISNRCTETEQYHTNFVHPSASGYGQMSDAYLACYVGVLTES